MSSDQVYPIPIETIEPHPDFLFRFEYSDKEFEDLVESIRKEGQLQNGRVVPMPDGKKYGLYIGMRRFFAVKKLFEETKDQRFAVYLAAIDRNMTKQQMVLRALEENRREVRRELTPLEEVRVFSRLESRELQAIGGERRYAKRAALAPSFEETRCAELHKIEVVYGFAFALGHLEELAKEKDERKFYMTAAAFAYTRASPKYIEVARRASDEVLGDERFRKLFPEYAKAEKKGDDEKLGAEVQKHLLKDLLAKLEVKPRSVRTQGESEEVESRKKKGQELLAKLEREGKLDEKETEAMRELLAKQENGGKTAAPGKNGGGKKGGAPGTHPPEVQRNAIPVACSHCGWENRTRLTEFRIKVENLPDAPGESPVPVEPEVLMKYGKVCPSCGKTFTINMLPVGREAVRVGGTRRERFEEPKNLVRPVTVKFDWERNAWEKYDAEGKLLGVKKMATMPAAGEGKEKGRRR